MNIEKVKKIQYKKYFDRFSPYLRLFLITLSLFCIFYLAFKYLKDTDVNEEIEAANILGASDVRDEEDVLILTSQNGINYNIAEPSEEEIKHAEEKYTEKLRRIEEEKRRQEEARRREKMVKVDALAGYLRRMGSPMAPYAEVIYDACMPYGVHYCKFFLSIAGVESGFGRIPLGCCNAWGMISMRWSSWNESIPAAANWLANRYYLKGVNTFEKLAYSGYHGGDNSEEGKAAKEKWIRNLYSFYNQIPL